MGISVLIPTYKRPQSIERFSSYAFSHLSGRHPVEIVFGCHQDDRESINAIEKLPAPAGCEARCVIVPKFPDGKPHLVSYWNCLFEQAHYDLLGFFGDDVLIKTSGWDAEVEKEFAARTDILVYGNDLHVQQGKVATLFFTHRRTHAKFGFYLYPRLRRYFMDEFLDLVYRRAGAVVYRPDLIFEHLHPTVFKQAGDQVYQALQALIGCDEQIWNSAECLREINRCAALLQGG